MALYGCLALLVLAVGVAGLMTANWPRTLLESWINIHALFGLMLCGVILARYQWCIKPSVRPLPGANRELSRHLSHLVYLFLYAVLAVRESISIVNSLRHGSPVDFNIFDQRFHNGPDSRAYDPKDDFQLFLASGLFALAFARVLASRMCLRSLSDTEAVRAAAAVRGEELKTKTKGKFAR